MSRLNVVVGVWFAVALACSEDGFRRPDYLPMTDRVAIVSALSDTGLVLVGDFGLLGCDLAIADPIGKVLRVRAGTVPVWTTIATEGNGPGELGFPRALATVGDSLVVVMDRVRKRLIVYHRNGELRGDSPMEGGAWGHVLIGRIAVTTTGLILDYWLTEWLNYHVSLELLETNGLVNSLNLDGTSAGLKWGTPERPASDDFVYLRLLLQAGDMAVHGDSRFVLRALEPRIEVFSLSSPTAEPIRTIPLPRYVETPTPTEEHNGSEPSEIGVIRGLTKVVAEKQAMAMAVDDAGRIYVIHRRPGALVPPGRPRELLAVYNGNGALLHEHEMQGADTRKLQIAQDGSVLILGSVPEDDARAIQVFAPVFRGRGAPCEWGQR